MYKRFLLVTVLAAFSTHVWAGPDLENRKFLLTTSTIEAVNQCKCLANAIGGQEKLFPMTAKSGDKSMIKTQANYLDLISDIKINASRTQTSVTKVIRNWDSDKNVERMIKENKIKVDKIREKNSKDLTDKDLRDLKDLEKLTDKDLRDQDLKDFNVKVSAELRALSSFCVQPFDSLANEIYKRSSILNRKKIDSAQCGIVRNKK